MSKNDTSLEKSVTWKEEEQLFIPLLVTIIRIKWTWRVPSTSSASLSITPIQHELDSHTLKTSEKKPEPIFSQKKSSIRARLDTALLRARYEEGRIRLGAWMLWSGGSSSPSSGSQKEHSVWKSMVLMWPHTPENRKSLVSVPQS